MATTITPIVQTITAIPTAGHRGVDSRDVFVTKQEAFQDALTATTVTELNTLKTQINTATGQINTAVDTVVAKEALVSPHYTAIDAVNANATNINAVASNEININNVSTNMGDINNLDTNMSDINLVADAIQGGTLPTIINDTSVSSSSTWSSSKIDSQINTSMAGLGTAATRDVGTGAGNVMEVGAFGLGASTPPEFSVKVKAPIGFYTDQSYPNTASPTNGIGLMYLSMGSDFYGGKMNLSPISNRVHYTYKQQPTSPSDWVELYHTGNLPITEQVYNLTGTAINPTNGTIQYKTVSANTTFTETLTDGQSVLLRLISANSYTITFPTITWVGVTAPVLTANCAIVLWKEQSTLYGAYVGTLV